MLNFDPDKLYFVPLGGCNEIGMNLNCYYHQGKWLLIDLGIGFADDWLPGVDVVLPDIEFLLEHKEDIAGLVVTHGHEDHIGAIPYLWPELECPVYATPFTSNVIKAKIAGLPKSFRIPLQEVKPGSKFKVGPFTLEMVPLTHSIPEMNAIAIHTSHGTILHTGDWKFDANPQVGDASNHSALEKLGKKGVLAIVCDSTNVFVEGESGSEEGVRHALQDAINQCRERVVITTFASNIARMQSIIYAAQSAGRKVTLAGRSLGRMLESAQESGYLTDIEPLISEKEAMQLPRNKVAILATGGQGEQRAALWRIARNEHPSIRINKGDSVLFSSRDIPGNETRIGLMKNWLAEREINVVEANDAGIHVSGHPARDELARMYQMIQPQIAVPVHGERRHLHAHAKLASELQVPQQFILKNGSVLELGPEPGIIGEVDSGYICKDGTSFIPSDGPVMGKRRKIRDNGIVLLSITVSKKSHEVKKAMLSAPGLLDEAEDRALLAELSEEVTDMLQKASPFKHMDAVEQQARSYLRKVFRKDFDKQPVISVHVLSV